MTHSHNPMTEDSWGPSDWDLFLPEDGSRTVFRNAVLHEQNCAMDKFKNRRLFALFIEHIRSIFSEEVTFSKLLWLPHTGGEDTRFEF